MVRLSSARVFILSWHPGGGLSGGMATSGREAVAGMKMSARLKFFLHSPQIRRPRHLLIRICAERRAEFQSRHLSSHYRRNFERKCTDDRQ